MMRHRRRRSNLPPQKLLQYKRMQEQEAIVNILTLGVSEHLKTLWREDVALDTCIAQLQEAKRHLELAEKFDPYRSKPRKGGKK
jgi:hypothetical protein